MQSTKERQGVIPPGTRGTAPAPAPSKANAWLVGAVVVLSVALIAAVAWALTERSANDTAAPIVASDAMVVQAVYDSVYAWTNGDADAIRQVYAPDAVYVNMIVDVTANGPDEIANLATQVTGDAPGWFKMTSLVLTRDGMGAYGFRFMEANNRGVALVEVNAQGQITYEVVRELVPKPRPANA